MEVINLIFSENNPAGIKAVLQCFRHLYQIEVRLPLVKASEKLQKEIANFVKEFRIEICYQKQLKRL